MLMKKQIIPLRQVRIIELSQRQQSILEYAQKEGPITGDELASRFHVSRAALRADLAILTMSGLLSARPRVGYFFTGHEPKKMITQALTRFQVKDAMSVPAIVKEASSLYDAVVTLFTADVGTLFVLDEFGSLTGVLSRKDLLKAAIGGDSLQHMPVSVIMTRMPNIVITTMEESALKAAEKLLSHEVDSLPVVEVDPEGRVRVIGRFSKTNITRIFTSLAE